MTNTPWKMYMKSKNHPIEKEDHLPNSIVSFHVNFPECNKHHYTSLHHEWRTGVFSFNSSTLIGTFAPPCHQCCSQDTWTTHPWPAGDDFHRCSWIFPKTHGTVHVVWFFYDNFSTVILVLIAQLQVFEKYHRFLCLCRCSMPCFGFHMDVCLPACCVPCRDASSCSLTLRKPMPSKTYKASLRLQPEPSSHWPKKELLCTQGITWFKVTRKNT